MAGLSSASSELELAFPCPTNILPSKSMSCFKIRSRPTHTSDSYRRGPVVARLPVQQASVPQDQTQLITDTTPDVSKLIPSPSSMNSFTLGENIRQQRKRSPSLSHSRGSSPSGRVRGSSPGGLEPALIEAVKRRVRRVQQARLYLLQQPGPNSFLVGGDSPEHKYKVVIGPQSCSCGRDPHCLHLLFVMLRVFQVPETDSRIYAKTLKNYEVESLFHTYQERRNSRVSDANGKNLLEAPTPNTSEQDLMTMELASMISDKNAGVSEEDLCPICLLAMIDGESLVFCTSGCRNKLHHHCMAIWAAECCQQGEAVLCPLCRKVWTPDPGGEPTTPSSIQKPLLNVKVSTPTKSSHAKKSWVIRASSSSSPTKASYSFYPFHYSDCIPPDQLAVATDWMKIFGKDLISCLYSRDWKARECALQELASEIEIVYQSDNEEQQQKVSNCCAKILTAFVADSVFKVYLSWIHCFQVLMNNTKYSQMGDLMRPIVRALLLKCADHNRRNCQLSVDILLSLAKGQNEELLCSLNGEQFELVLSCVVEDFNVDSVMWQWLAGRLIFLDYLIKEFPNEFWLYYAPLYPNEAGYKLQNYNRLMSVIEFAIKAMSFSHTTVNKLAKHIFVVSSSMAVKEKGVINQVFELLLTLEPDLQLRLRKKLQDVVNERDPSKLSCKSSKQIPYLNEPSITDRWYQKFELSSQNSLNTKRTPIQRPKDLPLSDPSRVKSKKPIIKFHHEPAVVINSQKKWGPSGLKIYNLFNRGKRDHLLPDRLDRPESSLTHKPSSQQANQETVSNGLIEEFLLPLPTCFSSNVKFDDDVPTIPGLSQSQGKIVSATKQSYIENSDWQRGPLLGTGGSSSCFQARDISTGTLMAVKQVSFCRNTQEEQSSIESSIEEEMSVMSTLNHPNIVRLLGATKQGKHFNIFVEWMAGGSVSNLLDKYGPFTDHVITHYTLQIISGLVYLHNNRILHRDLKGANLLVDSTGQRLRIGDFGAALRLGSKPAVSGEFQGQLLGTIAFMAPEVLRGEDYGHACDIWSLGCCIIEMATSEPPWRESNVSNHLALMYKIASSNEPPKVPENLNSALHTLTVTCLNMNPELRPSAKELLQHCPGPGPGDLKRVHGH